MRVYLSVVTALMVIALLLGVYVWYEYQSFTRAVREARQAEDATQLREGRIPVQGTPGEGGRALP